MIFDWKRVAPGRTQPAFLSNICSHGSRAMNRPVAFLLLSLGGGFAGLMWWCLVDFIVVRVLPYPDYVHELDWLIAAFPAGWFLLALYVFRTSSIVHAIALAAGATVIASLLALGLIFAVGFGFHLSMGGQL